METQTVYCKCGKPAKRSFNIGTSYVFERGCGNSSKGGVCCHSRWCFLKLAVSSLLREFIEEHDRVKRYGRKDDLTLTETIPDPDPYTDHLWK
jgi:hypothetical protein